MELNFLVGLVVRWTHFTTGLLAVGAFSALLLAGASDRPTGRSWESNVLGRARTLLLLALLSGLATLAYQTAIIEGRAAAWLEPAALARFLGETQAGHVWLARHGLLLLVGVFVLVGADTSRRADWLAARGEAALLAGAAFILLGASGHAAAVEPDTARAVLADAVHLLAAGAWLGALLPLADLLRLGSRPDGADARPFAVLAVRRFSRLALAAIAVLAATGLMNSAFQVGSVAGLLGTSYGRLLLIKLALLVPILALGVLNRRRLLSRLSGEAETVGRPAMRRLATTMSREAALGLLMVAAVAAMGLTPPAVHQQPTWPLGVRLSTAALEGVPELKWRALIGSQIAVLAVVAAAAALVLRARSRFVVPAATALLAVGLGLLLPPLTIDAYPTTYRRPEVTYHATSIARGGALYATHCARCHGPSGAGDGPQARGLPRPPPDLRAPHTGQHTAGDIFWWISQGIPRGGMPAFADQLGEEERWDLVNFVRTLGAAQAARELTPSVEPERPRLVAPDFSFAVGPMPARSLRDYRGRRLVLLVLYTLPESRPRLSQLAQSFDLLTLLGVEVIAVPRDAAPDAIRRLGDEPRILFPVVTDGAAEIVAAYGRFASAPHAELLIDRQGYLRARWMADGDTRRDPKLLLAEVQQLNAEKVVVPVADEHVH